MTLTTRLLLFYLCSLAILLAGFSVALYFVAREHLYRQADERLQAALNTLGAAVEVAPDGLEWETNERALRVSAGPDPIAWVVTDGAGRVVARSEAPSSDDLLAEAAGRFRGSAATRQLHWHGKHWQVGQRWFYPGGTAAPGGSKPADPGEVKYQALVITTALPLEPTRVVLRQLLAVLAGTSLGVLCVALAAGRFVCRRALRPVVRMAADARAVDPSDPARRIVTPDGGDELTDLTTAFNGLLDRLHDSAERHRRFAGDASHQLRTPLAGLLGQIEIALRRDRTAAAYRDVLAAAQAKAAHLQRIVESLLFLTRVGSEAGAPRRERLDLVAWLPGHLAQWAGHPRFGDIKFAEAQGQLTVLSHPVLLGEVVNVLLDNACRYSAPGSPITISLPHTDESARLEVADHGPGIAPADLPQVFTPFFRATDALRANQLGVGLGLSIARRLAEALGGRLSVTSRVGCGSCFAVTLPAAPPECP
jgi:signal transduction histidine kinase